MTTHCPSCNSELVTVEDATEPWCARCEWNLDAYEIRPQAGWIWNKIYRWDHRAGFRADRLLADLREQDLSAPIPPAPLRILLAVSAGLMLLLVASLGTGIWLLVTASHFWHVVVGILLLGFAFSLRPRFGRLKHVLEPVYRVPDESAATLRGLVAEIAGQVGSPLPDVLAFDFSWNAYTTVVGIKQTRVLVLGVPLVLALRPQELVALLGHELGHFAYRDSRRGLLTRPALTVFGAWSRVIRPRLGSASDLAMLGIHGLPILAFQSVAGLISVALFIIHVGLNGLDARYGRRAEIRADLASIRAAGSAAALDLINVSAQVGTLKGYVQHYVPKGEAGETWRRMLVAVRDREEKVAPIARQYTIRAEASLQASHPSPGRRHQLLSAQPRQLPTIRIDEVREARLQAEINPYARLMHETMLDYVTD